RITVSSTNVSPGGVVAASLSNSPGGAQDWIALAATSAPNETYLAFTYVGAGLTSRNWSVPMPNVAGSYEFRLFLDNGYVRAATSPTIVVNPAPGPCADTDGDRLCNAVETNT